MSSPPRSLSPFTSYSTSPSSLECSHSARGPCYRQVSPLPSSAGTRDGSRLPPPPRLLILSSPHTAPSGPYPEPAPSAWDVCLACPGVSSDDCSSVLCPDDPSCPPSAQSWAPPPYCFFRRLRTTLSLTCICWASSECPPWQGSRLSCSPGTLGPSTVLLAPGTCSINLC